MLICQQLLCFFFVPSSLLSEQSYGINQSARRICIAVSYSLYIQTNRNTCLHLWKHSHKVFSISMGQNYWDLRLKTLEGFPWFCSISHHDMVRYFIPPFALSCDGYGVRAGPARENLGRCRVWRREIRQAIENDLDNCGATKANPNWKSWTSHTVEYKLHPSYWTTWYRCLSTSPTLIGW